MFSLKNAAITSQSASNGGRISLVNAPITLLTEKTTAVNTPYHDRFIKKFLHTNSDTAEINVAASLQTPPANSGYANFLATGTQRDTQSILEPSRYYSAGFLTTAVVIGDAELVVEFPINANTLNVAQAGDTLVLMTADKSTLRHAIVNSVVFADNIATIQLIDGVSLDWAAGSIIASAITAETLTATIDNITVTGCTIDPGLITVSNDATIEQSFTLTFTSSTAFTVTGDTVGALPDGDIATQYAPLNPTTNSPYFTIPATTWIATTTANTLSFDTHPAALPIWFLFRFFPGVTTNTYQDAASITVSQF